MGLSIGIIVDRSREGHEVPGGANAFVDERRATRTAWALPLEYAFGKNRINVSYARASDTSGSLFAKSPIGTNDETGATLYNIGYKYWLDENTNFHFGWSRLNNKRNASYDLFLNGGVGTDLRGNMAARGTKVQSIQAGMLYRF
jgi:hypothetical protein